MLVAVVLGVIFITVFASLMTQGLWSNTLTLVNVITAGLVATNYFEPVADFLDRQEPSWGYAWDFIAVWLLFGVVFTILRVLTDFMSRYRVRFFMPVEKGGGIVMAIWASWMVLCFATFTLHTAPLSRNFLRGGFQREPESTMLFGLQPDRVWLGWVHRESRGTLSRFRKIRTFDSRGEFILRYGNRREEFSNQMSFRKPAG